jgi:hypothetical protein
MRFRLRHGLIAAFGLLAACAPGNVRLSQQYVLTTYSPGEFAHAAAGRDLGVVVAGNPFGGGDQETFARQVTDAMQGQHWGQPTNFTATPGPSARGIYRVVMLFGPPPSANVARLCGADLASLANQRQGEGIELMAAFCRDDTTRTGITGNISGASGPDDPAFRALVGQVTNGLFPPERDRERDRGDPMWLWN